MLRCAAVFIMPAQDKKSNLKALLRCRRTEPGHKLHPPTRWCSPASRLWRRRGCAAPPRRDDRPPRGDPDDDLSRFSRRGMHVLDRVLAPAGMPAPVIERLNTEFVRALRRPSQHAPRGGRYSIGGKLSSGLRRLSAQRVGEVGQGRHGLGRNRQPSRPLPESSVRTARPVRNRVSRA